MKNTFFSFYLKLLVEVTIRTRINRELNTLPAFSSNDVIDPSKIGNRNCIPQQDMDISYSHPGFNMIDKDS